MPYANIHLRNGEEISLLMTEDFIALWSISLIDGSYMHHDNLVDVDETAKYRRLLSAYNHVNEY